MVITVPTGRDEMSEQISTEVYLHAVVFEGDTTPTFHATTTDMHSLPEYTLVETKVITFDVPQVKAVMPEVIRGLEKLRDEMRALMSVKIMEVDNRIASLLALENDK